VISLEEYRRARAARLPEVRASEELLCVNLNPAPRNAIALSCYQSTMELSPELPEDYLVVRPEFMDRVYALASQI
jgi:hypothetical protein